MGFFKKTFKNQGKDINEQEAQQSVEKEGSEWMQNQFNTAKSYNDEDFVGGARLTETSTHLHRSRAKQGNHAPRSIGQGKQSETHPRLHRETRPAGQRHRELDTRSGSKAGVYKGSERGQRPFKGGKGGINQTFRHSIAA